MGVALRKNANRNRTVQKPAANPFADDAKLLSEIEIRLQKQSDRRVGGDSPTSSNSQTPQPFTNSQSFANTQSTSFQSHFHSPSNETTPSPSPISTDSASPNSVQPRRAPELPARYVERPHVNHSPAHNQAYSPNHQQPGTAIPTTPQSSDGNESPQAQGFAPIRWHKGGLIGAGSYGRVYLGLNMDTGELIAVKQIPLVQNGAQDAKALSALAHEVNLMKKLRHPNIVRYLGSQEDPENLNIFLEFIPGGSIRSLLTKFGGFNEKLVRLYTHEILLGLDYLHEMNVVHRDIKGANTLVDTTGTVKLADFGASKVFEATMKSLKGTPYWMAPEVIRQTGYGKPADVWSIGCTVIEMLTGNPPWSHITEATSALFVIARSKEGPALPPNMSEEGKHFLSLCFHRNPKERASVKQLLDHGFVKNIDSFVESEDGVISQPTDQNVSTADPNLSITSTVDLPQPTIPSPAPEHASIVANKTQPGAPAIASPPISSSPISSPPTEAKKPASAGEDSTDIHVSLVKPGLGAAVEAATLFGQRPSASASLNYHSLGGRKDAASAGKDTVSLFIREQVMLQTKKLMTSDIYSTLQKLKKPNQEESPISGSLKQHHSLPADYQRHSTTQE